MMRVSLLDKTRPSGPGANAQFVTTPTEPQLDCLRQWSQVDYKPVHSEVEF